MEESIGRIDPLSEFARGIKNKKMSRCLVAYVYS